jgi:hypothetical protein
MRATYEYGPRGDMPAVKVTWYQGEEKPPLWKEDKLPLRNERQNQKWNDGHLFIGDKGMLLSDYQKYVLLPEANFKDVKLPEKSLPRVASHHDEWLRCCRNGTQPSANFEYSGWLTEANHLGNVAYRVGRKIEWDPQTLKATNAPEADQYIRRPYRKGWEQIVA